MFSCKTYVTIKTKNGNDYKLRAYPFVCMLSKCFHNFILLDFWCLWWGESDNCWWGTGIQIRQQIYRELGWCWNLSNFIIIMGAVIFRIKKIHILLFVTCILIYKCIMLSIILILQKYFSDKISILHWLTDFLVIPLR